MSGKFVFVLLLVAAACGCGKKAADRAVERALEKDGVKAEVNSDQQKISITNEKGEKVEWSGGDKAIEIPKDFPKDVFVYAGAKPIGSMSSPEGHTLTLTTADKPETVAAAYKNEMTKAGWKEETAMTTPGSTMLVYKRENRSVMINIGGDDKATQIVMVVQKEEK